MIPSADSRLDAIANLLKDRARSADEESQWPQASLTALREGGVTAWAVPQAFGGEGRDGPVLLAGYERIASLCLTTAFILSQRDAATRRLRECQNSLAQRQFLPALARGTCFTTVGLSQLTTSRQHVRAPLVAQKHGDTFILNGMMPWVTGACQAEVLITGALTEEGSQLLIALPRLAPGVEIEPAMELMALQGSLTASVRCDRIEIAPEWILEGPTEKIMAGSRSGTGGLETSCLALGLTGAAVEFLEKEAAARPDLVTNANRLRQALELQRTRLFDLAERTPTAEDAAQLRSRANALVVSATQAALLASKGTGFLRQHPAQRWVRQALFFLVWSCPRAVAEATMSYLTPPSDDSCS